MLREGEIHAERLWKRFRSDRTRRLARDHFENLAKGRSRGWRWVLRDVDFSARRGEAIGLVGINGSGKSTLLKLLTGVMYPEAGRIAVAGRVGALIEVRAGIHPELTGRENIYLYGSLLGLRRADVRKRFDDIVEFAELADSIDRQTKFYSSGMQTRLGFSVAAFLEPDILLVDEVLAVGDASFQQRCLDRMRDVLAAGCTLVFVTHDLAALEAVCDRAVWLDAGTVRENGPVSSVLQGYRSQMSAAIETFHGSDGVVRLLKADVRPVEGAVVHTGQPCEVRVRLVSDTERSLQISLGITEGSASPIVLLSRQDFLPKGEIKLTLSLDQLPLPRGTYFLWAGIFDGRGRSFMAWQPAARFEVYGPSLDDSPVGVIRLAPVHVISHWKVGRDS